MKIPFSYLLFLTLSLGIFGSCKSSQQVFSKNDIIRSQRLIGLNFKDSAIDTLYHYLGRNLDGYDTLRSYPIDDAILPALLFDPLPIRFKLPTGNEGCVYSPEITFDNVPVEDKLPFLTVSELGQLIRTGKISSEYLTEMYINRIKKYDRKLKCVITLIEDEAIKNARKADQEIRNGNYRGPLHGIPYGVKDLVSVKGYPTTWGAMPYKDQVIDHTATIVRRFDEQGAILVAKLTSGALARGDVWWGGRTVNPWDTLQGASGSSAGSGSATAAGLVGFSIGTETMGSITSPSNRNGVTGLRPTYGRVSRNGVMPLAWSMDKVGPICRSAEDCALIFQAVQGIDDLDPTTYDVDFCYDDNIDVSTFKVGYLENLFEEDTTQSMDIIKNALLAFDELEVELIPDSLPTGFPFQAFDIILRAESGAFFDELVRSGRVDMMVQQGARSRANSLRQSRFIPAVEYLQANRHRKVLIEAMYKFMSKYDVVVSPTFGGRQMMITNLTGHPAITIPTGLDEDGHPTSMTMIGNLFEEAKIIRLAKAFQSATEFDEMHPPFFKDND